MSPKMSIFSKKALKMPGWQHCSSPPPPIPFPFLFQGTMGKEGRANNGTNRAALAETPMVAAECTSCTRTGKIPAAGCA